MKIQDAPIIGKQKRNAYSICESNCGVIDSRLRNERMHPVEITCLKKPSKMVLQNDWGSAWLRLVGEIIADSVSKTM